MLVSACGGSAGNGDSASESLADESADPQDMPSNPPFTPSPYTRQTDSATAHCYEPVDGEQAADPDFFLGCWERTLGGGERLYLEVFEDGRFATGLSGGDYFGFEQGLWEPASGGLVLFPPNDDCVVGGGPFDDACVRLFDRDLDPRAVRVAQQLTFNELTSFEWERRSECESSPAELDSVTLRDEGQDEVCDLDTINPVDLRPTRIELSEFESALGQGQLYFSLAPELPAFDQHDIQRNLIPSVQGFSLRLADGRQIAEFLRHNDLEVPGDFQIGARRDLLIVSFVHELASLPSELELEYEFAAAKYVTDTGRRTELLPVNR